MTPDDPRALLGTWTFERTVADRRAGESLTVAGATEFTLVDDGRVRWSERGTMHRTGSADVEVSRTLFVVRRDEGWAVTFEDGRDFHAWMPDQRVEHLCGADTYQGLAGFRGPAATARVAADAEGPGEGWTLTWWVSGPRKDYEMVTRFRRA